MKVFNKLNELTSDHSIILIKNTFEEFPNRLLVYDDIRWNCELFLNYKDNPNNETFIKEHLSSELKINQSEIQLVYKSQEIQAKYSESSQKNKIYCHKFYVAKIENFPEHMKQNCFEIDGRKYFWKTIQELEENNNTLKKNGDIIEYVKGII